MPDWTTIHNTKGLSPYAPFLAPLSCAYGMAVSVRLALIRNREKNTLPGFVVSLGNLTVGGTGKTPAACMIAEWALEEGYRPAVISRGYKGRYKEKILVVSDGDAIYSGPAEAGDEPYLLAKRLKGVPVIVSKDRYIAGLLAHERFETDFFILDDGFQHLALERDINIALVDGSNPFGNGHLLPWGPLREPLEEIDRADAVIITRSNNSNIGGGTEFFKNNLCKNKPIFRAYHSPEAIILTKEDRGMTPDYVKGRRVVAFAGIARPDAFEKTLADLGAKVLYFKGFPDHHNLGPDELAALGAKREELDADLILTTEKDWVKIEKIASDLTHLAYLTIRFHFLSGRERFFEIIRQGAGMRIGYPK